MPAALRTLGATAIIACCLGQSCTVDPLGLATPAEQVLADTPPAPPTVPVTPEVPPGSIQSLLDDVVIVASATEGLEPLSVHLAAATVSGEPLPEGSFVWDFGDGQSGQGDQVSHSFMAGSWKVTLCLTIGAGAWAATACRDQDIHVQSRPAVEENAPPVHISGTVTLENAPLPGVKVITSDGHASGVTDASGYYTLTLYRGWSGAVSVQHPGLVLTPPERWYEDLQASQPGQDFVALNTSAAPTAPGAPAGPETPTSSAPPAAPATLETHVVSGAVMLEGGTGLAMATLTPSGSLPIATTAADGTYAISVPDGWTGTIIAQKPGYVITPGVMFFEQVIGDQPNRNFIAVPANQPPHADAGPDQSLVAGSGGTATVYLDGSGSSDPDGTITAYLWTLGGQTLATTKTAAVNLPTGMHLITLRVTDDDGATDEDQLLVAVASAASWYVATNGNDAWSGRLPAPNATNTDGPFRTLQRAAGVVNPGETVMIRGGVYHEAVTITRGGTQNAPITYTAAAGETPVFDGQSTRDYGIVIHNAAYIAVNGLTIRNYRIHGVWLVDFADNITIRNCTVHGCGATGIQVRGGDDVLIEYNEVYGNTSGIFISWRDSNQNYPLRNVVRYNLAYDHGALDPESGDGIGSDAALNCTFEYNICWNNRDDGMDVSIRSRDNVIAHNIAILNGYPETPDGDGNGIKVSTNGGGGHIVHHNFALFNRRSGLDQDIQAGAPRNYFYNNTAYGNGESGLMLDSGGRGDSGNCAIVKNNLLAGNNRIKIGRPDLYACCVSPLLESNFNLIADGNTNYGGSVQEGPNSRFGDPKLANPEASVDLNPPGNIAARWTAIRNQILANYAILPGSPCQAAGTPIIGITQKAQPSIGAIE